MIGVVFNWVCVLLQNLSRAKSGVNTFKAQAIRQLKEKLYEEQMKLAEKGDALPPAVKNIITDRINDLRNDIEMQQKELQPRETEDQ